VAAAARSTSQRQSGEVHHIHKELWEHTCSPDFEPSQTDHRLHACSRALEQQWVRNGKQLNERIPFRRDLALTHWLTMNENFDKHFKKSGAHPYYYNQMPPLENVALMMQNLALREYIVKYKQFEQEFALA
jgi:hypothetical protein